MIREVDAPFVSRHNEFSEIYNELVTDKNGYEQAFNAESKFRIWCLSDKIICAKIERRIQQHLQRVSQSIRSFSKDVRHLKPDLASKTLM